MYQQQTIRYWKFKNIYKSINIYETIKDKSNKIYVRLTLKLKKKPDESNYGCN